MAAIKLTNGVMRLPGYGHWTVLHRAVRAGDEAAVRAVLAAGHRADCLDGTGNTPLYLAVAIGNEAIVRLLLEAGADQRLTVHDGLCGLYEAVRNGQLPIVRLLLAQQVRRRTLFCTRHEFHDAPLYVVSSQMRRCVMPENAADMVSLLAAASPVPYDLVGLDSDDDDDDDTDPARAAARDAADAVWRAAYAVDKLEKAAFALVRDHMADVAIGMASLDLPVLLMTMVFDEACAPPGANITMHRSWAVGVAAKHFHQRRSQ